MIAYVNGQPEQDTRSVEFVQRREVLKFKTTSLKSKIPKLINIEKINLNDWDETPMNIFELRDRWDLLDGRVKLEILKQNNNDLSKNEWIKYCLNVELLNKQPFIEDYSNNLKLDQDEAEIQSKTFYRKDGNYIFYVDEWVWKHVENKSNGYECWKRSWKNNW